MANRDLDSATQTEIAKPAISSFELLEIDLDTDYYYTNAPFNITYSGNTYQALGNFLQFSNVEESTDMQISNVTVTLTGLTTTTLELFLSQEFIDRPLTLHRSLYNDSEGIVGTFNIFSGRISKAGLKEDGDSLTVECEASSQFVDFERRAGRHTNDNEQQFHYSGDRFFEFASEVLKELAWKA